MAPLETLIGSTKEQLGNVSPIITPNLIVNTNQVDQTPEKKDYT